MSDLPRIGPALAAALLLEGCPAAAEDLTSASFRLRGAHLASLAATMSGSGPRFAGSGAALGQADALGFAGRGDSLRTSAPGFWPIAAGGLPTLDVDGDGLPSWLDPDDDDDGLLDQHETATGSFVSAGDTGSDPTVADSDGDGVDDGVEVDLGTDPNDPDSTPAIPLAPPLGLALLALALLAAPRWLRRNPGGSP